MSRCLWVVPKGIFPVRDGARVANQSLLKSVRPFFNELDIMIFNEKDSDELHIAHYNSDFNPSNVYFFKRLSFKNVITKLFFLAINFIKATHLPVTTGYFHTDKIKREVKQVLNHRKYDLIVFDGIHPYTAFMDLEEFKNVPVAYRSHNVEGDLWSTAASKINNRFFKKLLLWQGKKMLDLEVSLINRSEKTWNISESDLIRYKELINGDDKKLTYIPVGLEFIKSKASKVSKELSNHNTIKLLFLGKMDWAPNKDGLKWLLEEVWPQVDSEKFELQIVGSGDSSWGKELFKRPGVKFIGYVEDLEAVYANCDFSVIPIRYGSGTRIKVIESISKCVPIISTDMGVQGSGLKDFFHAETKEEWLNVLNGLDRAKGQAVAMAAFSELEKKYSPVSIGEKAYHSVRIDS